MGYFAVEADLRGLVLEQHLEHVVLGCRLQGTWVRYLAHQEQHSHHEPQRQENNGQVKPVLPRRVQYKTDIEHII